MRVARVDGYLLLPVVLMLSVVAAVAYLLAFEGASGAHRLGSQAEADAADQVARAGLHHALWLQQEAGCPVAAPIPATSLGAHSYSASYTGGSATTSFSLGVDQDAWIRSDQPDQNNGGTTDQHLRFESGNIEQGLYRFDLSPLALGATVYAASAWFHIEAGKEHAEGPITVHSVTADWTEAGATWNTVNGSFDASVLATIPAQTQGSVWVEINLTAQVQAWLNGQPNYGILLTSGSEGVHAEYVSREGASAERPRLEVVVGSGPVAPVAIEATGTLDSGITRTLRHTGELTQTPSTLTLQPPGDQGKDAYLKQDASNRNFGVATGLWVEHAGAGAGDTSLLAFDPGVVPWGATLRSATLELYAFSNVTSAPGGSIAVHRVTADWDEGTGDYQTGEVSWDRRKALTNWSTPGGDYDPTAVASTPIPVGTQGWYQWDVTALVNDWLSGRYTNQGLILVAETPETLIGFRSSDYGTESERPRLTLRYACACGSACTAPRGSGNVLFVVGSYGFPDASDQFREWLLGYWGYNVSRIDDDASQSLFDSGFASSDVVYVSETVVGPTLGTKLVGASIGVVSEEDDLIDELGFATLGAQPVGASVDVVDTTHFITRVFPAGPLAIYDAAMKTNAVAGTPAPALQTLANSGGAGGLALLDKGAALAAGGAAAGRRVLLPLGGGADIDWGHVNANGYLVLQRSLQWGTGLVAQVASPERLWLSTLSDVTSSGAPGLDAWSAGEALEFGDPNLALEPGTTDGTFSSIFDLDTFAGNADIDAIHYVDNDITVGSANSVDLLAGDVLLSTANEELLTSLNAIKVADEDVFVFRPATPGDYSSGTFLFLLDGSQIHAEDDTVGVSLVEKTTTVGDGSLARGTFVFATTNRRAVQGFSADDVGLGTTSGTVTEFIDGPSLSFGSEIRGMDVAEEVVSIGGHTVPAGSILLTLNNDDTGGVGDNLVPADSADVFYLTVTQVGASPVADATLLFEGADVNLDTTNEHLQALTLVGTVSADTTPQDLLLVVAAPTGLTAQEAAKQSLIESWGYTVTLIDDGASQADFDSAAAAADVVYVSGSISGGALAHKLTGSPTAIVNEFNGKLDNFGFSSSTASTATNDRFPATDAAHYIASPFSGNEVTVFISSLTMPVPGGTLAPDLQNVAGTLTSAWLAALDSGAQRWDGDPAPARRVHLPFGAAGGGDLTVDGETLMRRAIEWASGAGSGGGGGGCGSFADDFETDDYTGSTGTLAWANDWQEYNESDGAGAGDEQVRSDFASFALRVRDNDSGGEGAWREADLSAYAAATLSFTYWRSSLEDANDHVVIEVDGGSGYTEIGRIEGPGTDALGNPQTFSHDISGFVSAATRLRFRTSSSMGGTDAVHIDDVDLQVSGCAP